MSVLEVNGKNVVMYNFEQCSGLTKIKLISGIVAQLFVHPSLAGKSQKSGIIARYIETHRDFSVLQTKKRFNRVSRRKALEKTTGFSVKARSMTKVFANTSVTLVKVT